MRPYSSESHGIRTAHQDIGEPEAAYAMRRDELHIRVRSYIDNLKTQIQEIAAAHGAANLDELLTTKKKQVDPATLKRIEKLVSAYHDAITKDELPGEKGVQQLFFKAFECAKKIEDDAKKDIRLLSIFLGYVRLGFFEEATKVQSSVPRPHFQDFADQEITQRLIERGCLEEAEKRTHPNLSVHLSMQMKIASVYVSRHDKRALAMVETLRKKIFFAVQDHDLEHSIAGRMYSEIAILEAELGIDPDLLCEEALKLAPDDAYALQSSIKSLTRVGAFDQARKYIPAYKPPRKNKKFREENGVRNAGIATLAIQQAKEGLFSDSIHTIGEIVHNENVTQRTFSEIVGIALKDGDIDGALSVYEHITTPQLMISAGCDIIAASGARRKDVTYLVSQIEGVISQEKKFSESIGSLCTLFHACRKAGIDTARMYVTINKYVTDAEPIERVMYRCIVVRELYPYITHPEYLLDDEYALFFKTYQEARKAPDPALHESDLGNVQEDIAKTYAEIGQFTAAVQDASNIKEKKKRFDTLLAIGEILAKKGIDPSVVFAMADKLIDKTEKARGTVSSKAMEITHVSDQFIESLVRAAQAFGAYNEALSRDSYA